MDLDELRAERARLDKEVSQLLKDLAKIGKRYTTARKRVAALREEAEPVVVKLALLDVEQKVVADALGVARETIRRTEAANGIDRGHPRSNAKARVAPEWPRGQVGLEPGDTAKRLVGVLRRIGLRYDMARRREAEIRAEAEPCIVALARLGIEQKLIAEAFEVVRETIRRVEVANGIDRGDPRIKPGSRVGRTATARWRTVKKV